MPTDPQPPHRRCSPSPAARTGARLLSFLEGEVLELAKDAGDLAFQAGCSVVAFLFDRAPLPLPHATGPGRDRSAVGRPAGTGRPTVEPVLPPALEAIRSAVAESEGTQASVRYPAEQAR